MTVESAAVMAVPATGPGPGTYNQGGARSLGAECHEDLLSITGSEISGAAGLRPSRVRVPSLQSAGSILGRRPSSCGTSLDCLLPRLFQPTADLIVNIFLHAQFQMMREAPGRRLHNLLPARRRILSSQANRQDERHVTHA